MSIDKTGLLVAVEGVDGSGKTTFARELYKELNNQQYDVLLTREPGDSTIGIQLRKLLEDSPRLVPLAEFLLFAADRAQHFGEVVSPALASGKIVVSDRLSDSSLVYQGIIRGVNRGFIKLVNQLAMRYRGPDLTIYLHVDQETVLQRISYRKKKQTPFEERLVDKTNDAIKGFDKLYKSDPLVVTLDGTHSITKLVREGAKAIHKLLENKKNKSEANEHGE